MATAAKTLLPKPEAARVKPAAAAPAPRTAPPTATRVEPQEAPCACGGTCPRCQAAKKAGLM